jgi:hypothetical protein
VAQKGEVESSEEADGIAENLHQGIQSGCDAQGGRIPSKLRLTMKKRKKKSGFHLLLQKYRTLFRIPENQNHYTEEDYKNAERMFLKHALEQRRIEMQDDLFE